MKFLQAAVLSAICVGYVIASDRDYVGYLISLYGAIDEGRLDIAVELVKQNKVLGETGVERVIRKDDPDLIANFVNQTNQANASTLEVLWRASPIETFEKVLDKVDFPQQVLVDVTSSSAVVFRTDKFLVLLNKIVKPEDQGKVVESAIEQLVRWSTAAPLLDALKGKTFRSDRLEYLAIQKAFMEGVKRARVTFLPTDICNHAAITPELYADALIVTAVKLWGYDDVRLVLLKNADRCDLQAVKEKAGYADLNPEFRDAIEEALKAPAPGGTRTRAYDIQTVEKAEETFADFGSSGIPKDPLSIVSDFVALDAPARREGQTASKKAAKKVASDVTSTSTKIEGSGDIGSERVGEEDQA